MKILMVGWVDFRVSDAGSIHFSEIANAFYRLGNEVDVFVPKANAHAFFESRIKIIPMQNRMKETLTTAFWANVKTYFLLPFLLKKKKYDCVYFRWRMFPCGFLKIFTSSKIVTEHNGWIELEAKLQHSNKMISKIGKYLQLLDAQYADAIICVTDGIRKQFIQNQRKENHYYVVGNGTNTTHFYPLNNRAELKKKMLKTDLPVLGFIGNISKWQGLDDLIDIFGKISCNAIILIVGNGLYKKELEQKVRKLGIHKNVLFKDNIAYDQVNIYMNIMDVVFAPKSYALNEIGYSPLKIRDYAASGKPVISTAVNGIKQLEKYGWLRTYSNDDLDQLKIIVEEILYDSFKRKEMENKARKYAEKHFSWIQIAAKIIAIIEHK